MVLRVALITGFFITVSFAQPITDGSCLICHSPDGWLPLSLSPAFNHEHTPFPLEGAHRNAECIQCHTGDTIEDLHDFTNTSSECNACHMDIHLSAFGEDCQRCHTVFAWEMETWGRNHEMTLFPLTGAHAQIDCIECHGVKFTQLSGTLTTECESCHLQDYIANPEPHTENQDCLLCHNTRAWFPSDMAHHDLLFPIYSGEHRGEWSTCSAECHTNPDDYSDFSCGLNGVCHEHDQDEMDDEHLGEVSNYVYESQSCYDCHPNGEEDD